MISIIIPCRNEEKYIGRCLDSVIIQDYPKEEMEVLVVNGASEDKTREIVKDFAEKHPSIKLLENPKKFTPFGLNIGIKKAKGGIIIRMDAHALYEKDYISKCVRYLRESGADNVGGVIETLPANKTLRAKAIALCLSSFFGAGNSYFRTGTEKPRFVDTVFGGCYKREVFEKIGVFDERLIRCQDIEFNKRLIKDGGRILLVPEIKAYYYPSSNLKDFLKHNFIDGVWITYPLKFKIRFFSFRHLLPLFFVSSLISLFFLSFLSEVFSVLFLFVIFFYLSVSVFFSFRISIKQRDLLLLFILPDVFALRHFGYGLGSIFGFIKILKND